MPIKIGICTIQVVTILFWSQAGLAYMTNQLSQAIIQENQSLQPSSLTLTVVYDNYSFDSRLETAWGFSCLVEGMKKNILFDTGGDGQILLANMQKLGIDLSKIDIVVLSHIHGDHTGGLSLFLTSNPRVSVYLPQSFPKGFKKSVKKQGAEIIEIKESLEICSNVYSTGEMGTLIKEQSLIINTTKGLIVITGCAHPGIVKIIQKAKEITGTQVYLVLGGFHLAGAPKSTITQIIQEFEKEKVGKVAPCHCSGDLTRKLFEATYGNDFIIVGAGKSYQLNSSNESISVKEVE